MFYCNTITYFSKSEDARRGDSFESVINLQYLKQAVVKVKAADNPSSEWKTLNSTNVQVKDYYDEPLGNFFCMSAFKIAPEREISILNIDQRFFGFGFCLLILRQDLFMERLKKVLAQLPYKSCMKMVNYLDLKKYNGQKNLFQKDDSFSWQEEFRIQLYTNKHQIHDPFRFSIGSIEDFSTIYDLTKTTKFDYKL